MSERPRKGPKAGAGGRRAPTAVERRARARAVNPRLAQQTRRILGKHYANKYRVGRR